MSNKTPTLVKFPAGCFGLLVKPKTQYEDAAFLRLDCAEYVPASKPAVVRKYCMGTEEQCKAKLREFEAPDDLSYEVVEDE